MRQYFCHPYVETLSITAYLGNYLSLGASEETSFSATSIIAFYFIYLLSDQHDQIGTNCIQHTIIAHPIFIYFTTSCTVDTVQVWVYNKMATASCTASGRSAVCGCGSILPKLILPLFSVSKRRNAS